MAVSVPSKTKVEFSLIGDAAEHLTDRGAGDMLEGALTPGRSRKKWKKGRQQSSALRKGTFIDSSNPG